MRVSELMRRRPTKILPQWKKSKPWPLRRSQKCSVLASCEAVPGRLRKWLAINSITLPRQQ